MRLSAPQSVGGFASTLVIYKAEGWPLVMSVSIPSSLPDGPLLTAFALQNVIRMVALEAEPTA